jgi:hypothetical protein
MLLLLAVWGTGRHISSITRLSAELFGLLIAILFIEEAVKVGGGGQAGKGAMEVEGCSALWEVRVCLLLALWHRALRLIHYVPPRCLAC